MSAEVDLNSQENLKNKNINTNNTNNTNNNDSHIQELTKEPYVKDLLVKLDVLKNGYIKEKKLNSELSTKIKKIEQELTSKIIKLEDELMEKTSQIKTLIEEKNELEKTLKQQQQKKGIKFFDNIAQGMGKLGLNININTNNIKEKKPINLQDDDIDLNSEPTNNIENSPSVSNEDTIKLNEEIKKLKKNITQLKFENETYLKNMNKTLEDTENKRLEYKNEIKSYTNKIKNLEEKVTNLQKEKKELQDRINLTSSISSQTLKEKEHFKGLALDYQKGKEELEQQLNSCLEKYNKLSEENESNKQAILRHEINSGKMAQKLAELKSLYIKVNLRNQMFHVKKEGLISNTEIDIIFGKDDEGNYVMRIDDKNHKELINIQDVESINRVENSKNRVEISYMYKAKKYNMTVVVDELIVEQFVEAYKIFYWESMKDQNKINY